jgi:lycopene beta-cyclase
MKHYDVVCIGLGAASLSLLTRLAQNYSGHIAVIEQQSALKPDRTWCGWALRDHPFSERVTQRWQQWKVCTAQTQTVQSGSVAYEMLSSATVQAQAQAAIAQRDDWSVLMGFTVVEQVWDGQLWTLTLSSGDTLQTPWVLDSTGALAEPERPWLWQSFMGYELRAVRQAHPERVDLMDFRPVSDPAVVGFFYRLPIADDHCLLEWTLFTRRKPPPAELKAALDAELQRLGWQGAEVLRTELGHLPMQPIHPEAQPHWLKIGTAGGAMRPATGYAFHNIQRWADTCAQAILSGQDPVMAHRPRWLDWMDGVFLESLWQAGPEQASERFTNLFVRAPSAALTRFLMSEPTVLDILKIMLALPKTPLLKAAWTRGLRH